VQAIPDPEILRAPSGQAYIFWTGKNNPQNVFRIYAAPMIPRKKQWDGVAWHNIDPSQDVGRGVMEPGKPGVTSLTSDFAGTSTSFVSISALNSTYIPSGSEMDLEMNAVFQVDVAGVYQFRGFVGGSTPTQTVTMGGVYLPANQPTPVTLRCKFTGIAPGTVTATQLQYLVPAGGTLRCRPVAQAGIEACVLKYGDVAYPTHYF